jgi:TPR repeat protein
MYHNGFGVERDDGEAMKWFRNASEKGYYGKP